jgi:ribosomal protein L22
LILTFRKIAKIDKIISQIRGKSYKEALKILKYLPQKSSSVIWQTLYSAVSNGTNNLDFVGVTSVGVIKTVFSPLALEIVNKTLESAYCD